MEDIRGEYHTLQSTHAVAADRAARPVRIQVETSFAEEKQHENQWIFKKRLLTGKKLVTQQYF